MKKIWNWILKLITKKPEKKGCVCVGRLGLPGSGKSLDQTHSEVLEHLMNGEEVWSCYWINWAGDNWHYFQPRDFDAIKNLRNCVIVFDEVAQMWEPRDWESENSEVRAFFQLHRHRHNDIYFNTQDVSLVSKTVGIIASEWIKYYKVEPDWIRKLLKPKVKISMEIHHMTYQEMKKEAFGWELGDLVVERGDTELIDYKEEDLVRRDLNDLKVEIVHRYCPVCCARQGGIIKKEETEKYVDWDKKKGYYLKKKEYCPKHKTQELEIRETGLYDTDYEPETKQKDYTMAKVYTCRDCGHKKYSNY